MDQVLGGVVLYLNIGLTFATIYALIENVSPGAFHAAAAGAGPPLHPSYFIYFSFVTLTTVGYGDIVPVHAAARSMATLEAALGQLYPAIILARLVSIEVSQRDQAKIRSEHRQQVAQDHGRAPATSETKAAKSKRESWPARSDSARMSRIRDAERLGDLPERPALHLHGGPPRSRNSRCRVRLAVDVLVARQDRAEHDPRRRARTASGPQTAAAG